MPQILIRDISDEAAAALQAHAAAAGLSREAYVRLWVESLTAQALVKAAYTLRAFGPDAARAYLRREAAGVTGHTATNMSLAQAEAYRRAVLLVERNAAGDREQAIGLLQAAFDEVFET